MKQSQPSRRWVGRFEKLIGLFMVLGLFQFISILPSNSAPRLSFPGSEQYSYDCDMTQLFELKWKTVIDDCGCPENAARAIGFPYKENLYDRCQQLETRKIHIVLTNIVIQSLIIVAMYFATKKSISLVKSRTNKV